MTPGTLRAWPALQEVTATVLMAVSVRGRGQTMLAPCGPRPEPLFQTPALVLGHGAWGCAGAPGRARKPWAIRPPPSGHQQTDTHAGSRCPLREPVGSQPQLSVAGNKKACVCPQRGHPLRPGSLLPPCLSLPSPEEGVWWGGGLVVLCSPSLSAHPAGWLPELRPHSPPWGLCRRSSP